MDCRRSASSLGTLETLAFRSPIARRSACQVENFSQRCDKDAGLVEEADTLVWRTIGLISASKAGSTRGKGSDLTCSARNAGGPLCQN